MERHRTISRQLGVVIVPANVDTFDVVEEMERVIEARFPGVSVILEDDGRRIVVPPAFQARIDGRQLRDEEYSRFDDAVREAAAAIDGAQLLTSFDEMIHLDWNRFTKATWNDLSRAYREMPSFIPDSDLPRWFSADETAPHLWGSVEPPGLQVGGLLELERFSEWLDDFLIVTRNLPYRDE